MSINKSNILIILPAYNEASVIGSVLSDIQKEGYSNICLIDDGSSDNTHQVAQRYEVEILTHPINRGAGAATQTGINYAKNNAFLYAILMDSDGQHVPNDIESLYMKMKETDADIIIGNRFFITENDVPKHRIAYNRIANIFTNFFCKKKYADTQSGFRLLNRKAIEMLDLKTRGFGFCSEMIIESEKLNLQIEESPIRVLYTKYSLNKGQNLREGARTASSILWRVFFG
ncbi:MAG: glycosyltransferase involved in cell wall biosynthesis [Saprospiraceae bacterium]|jgi:glycosyltransferase involved in cell wall biosynthesis|tara:strand:+ start:57 stop:746 length:690 start_codon:yes stop_codon:yes gene_type:complete